jgi:hypothetical protein
VGCVRRKSCAGKLLRDRVAQMPLSKLMAGRMGSLLAVVEGRFDDAYQSMEALQIAHEPEVLVYLARYYSYVGAAGAAVDPLRRAAQSAFICAPDMLRSDAWLSAAHRQPEFASLLGEAEKFAGQVPRLP